LEKDKHERAREKGNGTRKRLEEMILLKPMARQPHVVSGKSIEIP